jgi:hypothetical protein
MKASSHCYLSRGSDLPPRALPAAADSENSTRKRFKLTRAVWGRLRVRDAIRVKFDPGPSPTRTQVWCEGIVRASHGFGFKLLPDSDSSCFPTRSSDSELSQGDSERTGSSGALKYPLHLEISCGS